MWASAVVLSILQRMDVWHVDGGRILARKIHKTESSLGSDAF
jgi:ATP phosphoribosyltransferase regulatory subunit HisZ